MIIFGWGKQTAKDHGPVYKCHCDHCNNEQHWELYSRTTWFTLFFIPVIPYSFERLLLCPICSYGVKLDKGKFEELKAIAECNTDLIKKRITEDEYQKRIQLLMPAQTNQQAISE